ncbi:AzlC family ABC transporter permease [Trinickia soli]|nr:AzlC family ABC transporter permease [Trinickia soli]
MMNVHDLAAEDILDQRPGSRSAHLRAGAAASLPLLASAFPMGLVGGALGVASGLSIGQTTALAALLNSGTAQFLAFKLIQVHAAPAVVICTSLTLSLRMVMYGLSLRAKVRQLSTIWRVVLGFGLIDAVFMVMTVPAHSAYAPRRWRWFYLGVSGAMYGGWILATVIGASLGETIATHLRAGLDFPLVAVFGAMLASTLSSRSAMTACTVAAVAALLTLSWPYHIGLLVSTLVGVAAGAGLDRLICVRKTVTEES